MIGTIQQANKSKSGKTLSIQVDGVWYTSKNWELEQAVGKRIVFEASHQTFPDGSSIQWLNDYVFEDASTTPSAQAFDRAMDADTQNNPHGAPQAMPRGQRAVTNKDALIGALALTKSITGSPEQVWESFVYFYHKMDNFDPSVPF